MPNELDPRIEAACVYWAKGAGRKWPDDWDIIPRRDKFRSDMAGLLAAADAARENPVAEAIAYESGYKAGQDDAFGLPVSGSQSVSPWRPIEEAPKDGTSVMLFGVAGEGCFLEGVWCRPNGSRLYDVTHFTPLPNKEGE